MSKMRATISSCSYIGTRVGGREGAAFPSISSGIRAHERSVSHAHWDLNSSDGRAGGQGKVAPKPIYYPRATLPSRHLPTQNLHFLIKC